MTANICSNSVFNFSDTLLTSMALMEIFFNGDTYRPAYKTEFYAIPGID
jgi:hypothetical protein